MNETLAITVSNTVINAKLTALASTETLAAGTDILSDWKAMAIGLGVTLAITLIIVGSFFTIPKLREGTGEAIIYQIGLIVLGVIVALSVGIAAALYVYAGEHHIVDQKFIHQSEWGS
jgi:hypothetical protein